MENVPAGNKDILLSKKDKPLLTVIHINQVYQRLFFNSMII